MDNPMQDILDRMAKLQDQLEDEIGKRRAAFRYRLDNGRVVFEAEARKRHRALRVRFWAFLRATRPLVVLTAPVIYALIIPFLILDLFVTVYHAICFPVYGIPKVRRRDHVRIDRHHLAYLNALQKLNCVYCGYCNGVVSYVREIASRTEAYWCPIKHAARINGAHARYAGFMEFGDGEGFEAGVVQSRNRLRQEE
ncbi:hypothetical protein [Shimia sp. SDUM112013]|uniref:hypothetical protein n=1 Tax=Shimia sp. SDUM112013 TaxID=3136160 RepID=UPI0032EAEC50